MKTKRDCLVGGSLFGVLSIGILNPASVGEILAMGDIGVIWI